MTIRAGASASLSLSLSRGPPLNSSYALGPRVRSFSLAQSLFHSCSMKRERRNTHGFFEENDFSVRNR